MSTIGNVANLPHSASFTAQLLRCKLTLIFVECYICHLLESFPSSRAAVVVYKNTGDTMHYPKARQTIMSLAVASACAAAHAQEVPAKAAEQNHRAWSSPACAHRCNPR
jgi:hypothetical protein